MSKEKLNTLQEFDSSFRSWVESACKGWKYPMPSDEYYAKVYERLPEGLRALLGFGLNSEIIIPKEGGAFTLKGLSSRKGPYHWFSRNRRPKEPAPNWEYFVQVAEFVRIHTIAVTRGLSVAFQGGTMDIALYQGRKLLVYFEVKERVGQLQRLLKEIKEYQTDVDLAAPNRGNDPLRKAKCIVELKPEYFVGVAIGARFEYKVVYLGARSFQLARDTVPFLI